MNDRLPPWRAPLDRGRAAFNRGEFFAAHEHWEEAWHQLEGTERMLLQGLIQIAAGLHHLQEGRPQPASSLLAKGLRKLPGAVPAALADLPIDALAGDVARLLVRLKAPAAGMPDPRIVRL